MITKNLIIFDFKNLWAEIRFWNMIILIHINIILIHLSITTSHEYIELTCVSTFNCGFICKHLLFVQHKTKTKKVYGFHNIFFAHFQDFTKKYKFLKFWSFINLPLGHVRPNKFFWPDWFNRFDVYWIQTNNQTYMHR